MIAMLTLPLVALIGLYAFALVTVAKPVLDLRLASVADRDVRNPGNAVVEALQAERKAADAYLALDRIDPLTLQSAEATTDAAVSRYRRLLSQSELRSNNDVTRRKMDETIQALDKLPAARQAVATSPDRPTARMLYTTIIWAVFALFDSLPESVTSEVAKEQAGQTATARLNDQLSEEDAAIAGLALARRYTPVDSVALTQLIGAMANQINQASALFTGDLKDLVDKFIADPRTQAVYAHNNPMLAKGINGGVPPTDPATWNAVYQPALALLKAFIAALGQDINRRINDAADTARLNLTLTGLGGLLAVALSLLLTIRLGRSVSVRLAGLRGAALDLADARLPDVVARLRRGERVDAALEAPPLDLGDDEIGQVGQAFNRVRRTAIEAAVDEATLRQGINQFFVNIARRSQSLLHRQLALLDSMERRTTEPEELENLFRIDHLATRMRRHAEDLVILAGNTPGRGWRQPVPMIDVIRGAISEIEDYSRVKLSVLGEEALIGPAVGDLVHLLAELIENGTHYSPPTTPVIVTGQAVGNGFAVEIEDRGLGMTPEALEATNRRLLNPPDFDLADSAQLGLFVVARLAAKHGIRVQLRHSIFAGVTAVVLIPTDLIVAVGELGDAQHVTPHNGVTQQFPAMVGAGQHRADGDTEPAAAGTNGYAGQDQQESFEWLRSRTPVPPPTEPQPEAPLRLTASAERPDTPTASDTPTSPAAPAAPTSPAEPTSPARTIPAAVPIRAAIPVQPAPSDPPSQATGPQATGPQATGPQATAPHAPLHVAASGPTAEAEPGSPTGDPAATAPRLPRPRGLPRRIRQASLAPQLKNTTASIIDADQAPVAPTPELIRTRMSSFQAGMKRGRRAGAGQTGQEEYK
ncbi:histidine kinase [Planosporangium thailandense]|uniref:histidine kinase n=1 Tax=Planosporangium thailandense TaxID=765197 RepID=A0ABX0Y890_9ACTN|nr:nitrate- and nitrite sensing domain-containing protein [Planosporangium thailandense]NJC73489.1 histidine kinase [Planosporangium thailandense]